MSGSNGWTGMSMATTCYVGSPAGAGAADVNAAAPLRQTHSHGMRCSRATHATTTHVGSSQAASTLKGGLSDPNNE